MHSNLTASECCFLTMPRGGCRLVWEATHSCPHSCHYCFTSSSPSRSQDAGEPDDVATGVCRLVDALGVRDVLITGGEPLSVVDRVLPVVSHLRSRHVTFSVSTNGEDEDALRQLLQFGPRAVNLSVDPPPPSGRRHGNAFKASYERVTRSLGILARRGIPAKLTAVVDRTGLQNLPVLLEWLSRLLMTHTNICGLAFNGVYPIGRGALSLPLSAPERARALSRIGEWACGVRIRVTMVNWGLPQANATGCPCGSRLVAVLPNGDVAGCTLLYNLWSGFAVGNILEDPASGIIRNLAESAAWLLGRGLGPPAAGPQDGPPAALEHAHCSCPAMAACRHGQVWAQEAPHRGGGCEVTVRGNQLL